MNWRSIIDSRHVVLYASVIAATLTLGCEEATPVDDVVARPQESIDLALSELTPNPSQSQVIIIDYSGPDFDESDLHARVGTDTVVSAFFDNQISLIMPMSASGDTTLSFDFGADRSSTLSVAVSEAPSIPDPEQYLESEISKLLSLLGTDGDREVSDALLEAQAELASLSEQELSALAVFYKQNLEPALTSSPLTRPSGRSVSLAASVPQADFDADKCWDAANDYWLQHSFLVKKGSVLLVGGLLIGGPLGYTIAVGAIIYTAKRSADEAGDVLELCLAAAADSLLIELADLSGARVQAQAARRAQVASASRARISMNEGEPQAVTITVTYDMAADIKSRFISAMSQSRNLVGRMKNLVGLLTDRFAGSFDAILERFPESAERTEKVAANGFALTSISNSNISGSITGRDGDRLTLTFRFDDRSLVPPEEAYVDFTFTLQNLSIGIDDVTVRARLNTVIGPSFGDLTAEDLIYVPE